MPNMSEVKKIDDQPMLDKVLIVGPKPKSTFGQRVKKIFMDNQKMFYELMFWEIMLGVFGILQSKLGFICLAIFAGFRFGLYVAWQIFIFMIENWELETPENK
jgi:hypothetical protein